MSKESSSEEEKSYKCKHCGAIFKELWKLGSHVKHKCEEAKKARESVKETPMGEPPKRKRSLNQGS